MGRGKMMIVLLLFLQKQNLNTMWGLFQSQWVEIVFLKNKALHAICAIHTVSRFHGAALNASAMARNVCRDPTGCVDCTAGRASVWIATIFVCCCNCTRSVLSPQAAASHHLSRVRNCLTVVAPRTALQPRIGTSWASNDDLSKDLSNTIVL